MHGFNLSTPMEGINLVRAYASGTTTVSDSTNTVIQIDTVTDGYDFDTSNYRFVASQYGIYYCQANIEVDTGIASSKTTRFSFRKNGSDYGPLFYFRAENILDTFHPCGGRLVEMDPGDYIELVIWHNYGVNATINGGSNSTFLQVYRVGHK